MKKFVGSIIILTIICSCIFANANYSVEELQEDISTYRNTKDVSHQMAECARQLGYSEDHMIIQIAKSHWQEAHIQQCKSEVKLNELNEQSNVKTDKANTTWTGPKLTKSKGVNWGPQGKETYYNLNMSGVVKIMRNMGYDSTNYPYWVRDDGCKMLGPYIMVAANLSHFPRGSIVECSLGWAIVCDTGGFAKNGDIGYNQLDIATNW